MYHDESSTDLSSLDSSSPSPSPIFCKTDPDDIPYIVQSSPPISHDGDESSVRSNNTCPSYIVQSPSSDSDKSSFPEIISPSRSSPSRLSSSFSSSSGSRVSGMRSWNRNWNWNRRHEKGWNQCYMIMEGVEEEEREKEEEEHGGRGQIWLGIVWVLFAFCFVCLVFWGCARPYKPRVAIESLAMNNFYYGEGLDYTGVPTKLITVNCTLHVTMRNPSSYFGIHLSTIPVDLSYLEVTVATGRIERYYLRRKSKMKFSLNMEGNKIPIYGAGLSLAAALGNNELPLGLRLDIKSHINVFGKIVKTKHLDHISCSTNVSTRNNGLVRFKENSCKYS